MLLPHEVLGVSPDADVVTIKRVFRGLVKEWHPDRNRDPRASAHFREVVSAYRHLVTAERRAGVQDNARANASFDPFSSPSWVAASAAPVSDDFSWEDRRPVFATAYPARLARIVVVATLGTLVLFWASAFLSQL
ncbi:MAG: DnaJ domain-containing protein [Polyangiaceae bacterium]